MIEITAPAEEEATPAAIEEMVAEPEDDGIAGGSLTAGVVVASSPLSSPGMMVGIVPPVAGDGDGGAGCGVERGGDCWLTTAAREDDAGGAAGA